jgi:hypothetical protein
MSRRFSNEPINLIHRIPSPEQLSAARPLKRSFGQTLVESGAAFVRAVAELWSRVMQLGRRAHPMVDAEPLSQDGLDQHRDEWIAGMIEHLDKGLEESDLALQRIQAVASPCCEGKINPLQAGVTPDGVQPEEVAELRAYLLSQQQDIACLSAQMQELKSLLVSQQQVLAYLGKELEIGSLSHMTGGVAFAAEKRNRTVRQKPVMKNKAVPQKDDNPKRPSLSF